MGSIVMTEIKVDNIVNVAGTGKPNFPVAPTHSTGSALSTLNTYQYDTTTRVVTVVDDNGTNKFAIDGVTAPTITLLRGVTYTFDVSDSSVSTHPLAFKNGGTSYTTGITSSGTAGTTGATVTFAVAADAPLTGLTYYCTTHGDGMGSSVTTSDPKNGAMLWDGAVKFYIDSEFKAIGTSGSGSSSSGIAWGGDRGIRAGGNQSSNTIDYWDMTTPGNATDFGDLLNTHQEMGATSNQSRGVFFGGFNTAITDYTNIIQYITVATTGNSTDFGDLTTTARWGGAAGDGTYGVHALGSTGTFGNSTNGVNNLDYVTIATTGNAQDFGDLTVARYNITGAGEGSTYALFFGGVDINGSNLNNIDYITVATPGNATDFGDIVQARASLSVCSDSTRTIAAAGSYTNHIEYVTTNTPGNTTDFGDLPGNRNVAGACSNGTYGHIVGGDNSIGGRTNQIDTITIQTPGNSTDFGDLTEAKRASGVTSGAAS